MTVPEYDLVDVHCGFKTGRAEMNLRHDESSTQCERSTGGKDRQVGGETVSPQPTNKL